MCRPNLTQHLIGYDNFVFQVWSCNSQSLRAGSTKYVEKKKTMVAPVEKGSSDY